MRNAAQNALAAEAVENEAARSALAASLRPLTEHLAVNRDDLARQALDTALAEYRKNPDFAIGTYYSWHLRTLVNER